MTPDEAKSVLAAAWDASAVHRWAEVDEMLRPVHTSNVLTGTDQGDTAYLLGLAYFHLGFTDAAKMWLTDASTTAAAANRANAQQELIALEHNAKAITAEASDGVGDKSEGAAVLAAADEALQAGDFDRAQEHYTAVYDSSLEVAIRTKGALGLGTVLAHRGDLAAAKQYADYVLSRGLADSAPQAQTLLDWIKQQDAATAAMSDGASVDEYLATNQAAMEARDNGNPEHARALLLTLFDASHLAPAERSVVAFNLGVAEATLGMYDDARLHLELAAHGPPDVAAAAAQGIAAMDRHESAEEVLAKLQP
jgi:tetratricopeptide (TPR) repeat protein